MRFRISALAIGGLLGLIATLTLAVIASGPDEHGLAEVPGETTVELPGGKEQISYQDTHKRATEKLLVPRGLRIKVQPYEGGKPLPLERDSGDQAEEGSLTRTGFATVEIPDSGFYFVTATGGAQRAGSELAFGRDFWHRLTSGGYLLGLIASLVAIAVGVALLLRDGGLKLPSRP